MKLNLLVAGYIFFEEKVLLIYHKKYQMWLPVAGHIEVNESPDEALQREVQEEVNLSISFVQKNTLSLVGNIKENTALPFSTNIHVAGDHDHYCLYFVCTTNNISTFAVNSEIKEAKWFSKEELIEADISLDIREQALLAFEIYEAFH